MSRLEDKLKDYEDFELAFMLRYKTSNYMESTLTTILKELQNRGINKQSIIDDLVSDKLNSEKEAFSDKICPRCTSTKILSDKEPIKDSKSILESPKYTDHKICAVCGWDFSIDDTAEDKRNLRRIIYGFIFSFILFITVLYIFS